LAIFADLKEICKISSEKILFLKDFLVFITLIWKYLLWAVDTTNSESSSSDEYNQCNLQYILGANTQTHILHDLQLICLLHVME